MSYDVTFRVDVGGGNTRDVEDAGNYTYNCGPMFRLALGGDGLNDLDGRNAGECVEVLRRGVEHMSTNPAEYIPLNPPNGWGKYESALEYLRGILRLAEECPATTISVH